VFTWTPDMQIDGGPIDNDHRKLLEIANQILELSTAEQDVLELQGLIRELYDYVKDHFHREEQYMTSLGYPGLAEHKALHRSIIQDMNRRLNQSYHLGQILGGFRQLMTTWVVNHILTEDRKIYRFIAENE
jgi:hemerythrin